VSVVVVGNPKPNSRTRRAAELLADRLGSPATAVIDVIDLGPGLLGWGDELVVDAVESVKSAELVIFASPTFKATYSGVLKLFLDQFGTGELKGVVAIPLMLGAAPHHAMAPELLLKPVLVEIGCTCPTPGLYLVDSNYEDSPRLASWLAQVEGVLPLLARR
jgi:FMN reductase